MNDFINKMGEYWSQLSFDKLGDILTYHHNAPILFSSGLFFFLFIGFLIIYMSLRKHLLTRIIYVTLFSIYFYYKSSGLFFFLLLFVATSDFCIAQCMADGFPMEAQSMGCLEPVYRLRAVGIFQILQFPTGDHGCRCS